MEGFKNSTKIQYFKDGGSVSSGKKVVNKTFSADSDLAQDKALVKKGVRQHEAFLHKNEPKTELSLKTGGRSKKTVGTVNKFKDGGCVTNVYEAKKKSGDKDAIQKVKQITPEKAEAPSAAKNVKNTTAKFCGGKSVKKMANGGSTSQKLAALEQMRAREKMARAKKYLGPAQQSELINQSPEAAGLTPPAPAGGPAMAPSAPAADLNSMPMKKGGKASKKC